MSQYLIMYPLVPLAGLANFAAGGDGFTTLFAYLIAGVFAHMALGVNKPSSAMDATVSMARLVKHGFLKGRVLMVVCSSAAVLMGSVLGAYLAFIVPEPVTKHMVIVVLPVVAFYVLRNKDMGARDRMEDVSRNKVFVISVAAAFSVGGYDGFYGPGTETLLILILTGTVGMDIRSASAQTEVINLSSSIAASVTSIIAGNVYYPLGLTAGVYSIAGHYIGVGMVAHDGQKVVRPVVLTMLEALFTKITSNI